MNVKILVVVPTHPTRDRTQYLAEAMESLRIQTRPADWVVVTGNKPTVTGRVPNVTTVLSDLPFHDRVNQAIDGHDCDAFMILSDDDKLDRTYIEKTAAAMESGSSGDTVVDTVVDVICTSERLFGQLNLKRPVFHIPGTPNMSSLYRKRSWGIVGGYRGVPYTDQDFWMRCRAAGCGKLVWIQEPLLWYRVHEGQESVVVMGGMGGRKP